MSEIVEELVLEYRSYLNDFGDCIQIIQFLAGNEDGKILEIILNAKPPNYVEYSWDNEFPVGFGFKQAKPLFALHNRFLPNYLENMGSGLRSEEAGEARKEQVLQYLCNSMSLFIHSREPMEHWSPLGENIVLRKHLPRAEQILRLVMKNIGLQGGFAQFLSMNVPEDIANDAALAKIAEEIVKTLGVKQLFKN